MPDRAATRSQAAPFETITVTDRVAACDGGGGPLGHPRVFLRIVGHEAVCPYCSRTYVLAKGAGHAHRH